MSFTKTYFLCPTTDFIQPPPAGPLCLGSIVRSTSSPQSPLNGADVVPVANPSQTVVETEWKKTISAEKASSAGVYAQFLRLAVGGLPIGPEVDIEHSHKTENVFAFDTMTTLSFDPTPQYVERAIKAPAVQAWLKEPKQRFSSAVSLFLVVGIKIVKGAKIEFSSSKSRTLSGNIGIDLPPIGMTFGPKGEWSRSHEDKTEFNRDSEFVFAFRVKRLKIGRKLKVEEYNKGAFLAVENDAHNDGDSVLVEDVDGSDIKTATIVPDEAENDGVYCVPA